MKPLVIIHGLGAKRERYTQLEAKLASVYKVYYFEYDWKLPLKEITAKLVDFLDRKGILEADFVTHSFGSIVFRTLLQKNTCTVGRLVQLAPLNQGSKLLTNVYKLFWGKVGPALYGQGPRDFLSQQSELLAIPLPQETGVIIGTKNFDPKKVLAWVIPLVMNIRDSDGKVKITETQAPGIKEYRFLTLYHSYLMSHDWAIEKIYKFLTIGKF